MDKFLTWLKKARRSRKKYIITVVLAVLVVVLGWKSYDSSTSKKALSYPQSLDQKAVCVNGTDLTLRQLAFYVAYEEGEVEKQAEVYNPDDPKQYWNVHTDGQFVRVAARNAAIQMAIHDEIFYQMAMKDGTALNEEEQKELENKIEDFWSDLTDRNGDDGLGITKDDIVDTMSRIALAEKYQYVYEELQNADHGDYDFSGEAYEQLKEKNKCKIYRNVWSRVSFGHVTLGTEL